MTRNVMAAVVVVLLVGVALLIGCIQCGRTAEPLDLVFDATEVDVGEVRAGRPVVVRFPFENGSSVQLVLSRFRKSCNCGVVSLHVGERTLELRSVDREHALAAHESGAVRFAFAAPQASGEFTRELAMSSSGTVGFFRLTVSGAVVSAVQLEQAGRRVENIVLGEVSPDDTRIVESVIRSRDGRAWSPQLERVRATPGLSLECLPTRRPDRWRLVCRFEPQHGGKVQRHAGHPRGIWRVVSDQFPSSIVRVVGRRPACTSKTSRLVDLGSLARGTVVKGDLVATDGTIRAARFVGQVQGGSGRIGVPRRGSVSYVVTAGIEPGVLAGRVQLVLIVGDRVVERCVAIVGEVQ